MAWEYTYIVIGAGSGILEAAGSRELEDKHQYPVVDDHRRIQFY